MLNVMSAEAMREIDRTAIELHRIPSAVLMDAAGMRLSIHAEELLRKTARDTAHPRILILCGKGNNGGDGYACARHLDQYRPEIGECFPEGTALSADAELFRGFLSSASQTARFKPVYGRPEAELLSLFQQYDLIIDAVYGTGFHGEVRDSRVASILAAASASGACILSADIPSGVSASDGSAAAAHIQAERTVTFTALKTGLVLYPGAALAGEICVEQIGIPPAYYRSVRPDALLLDKEWVAGQLKKRPPTAHKGSCGKVLCIGGSKEMPGSITLSARAALLSGSGLVRVASIAEVCQVAIQCENSLLAAALPSQDGAISAEPLSLLERLAQESDAILIGPGMTRLPAAGQIVRHLMEACTKPMVVDADALFALAQDPCCLNKRKAPLILTPHEMELARLLGTDVREISAHRLDWAREFCRRYPNVTLVLKGAHTIIATPFQIYFNPTGNEGMATAGSGDVLAGICAALLADGMHAEEAAAAAVYLHGKSGDLAVKLVGIRSCTASAILTAIPEALKQIEQ